MGVDYAQGPLQNPFIEETASINGDRSMETMNEALSPAGDRPEVEEAQPRLQEVLRSLRVFNSLRICLATTICVCISAWFRIPLCFESVIGVLVLFSIYNSRLVQKGLERFFGRVLGVVAGLVLADLLYDVLPLFALAMTVALFWGMYRYVEGKIPYGSANAAFTLAAIMIVATVSPTSVTDFGLHWVLQVGIGVAVALIINVLLPFRVGNALNTGTMEIFDSCAERLHAQAERIEGRPDRTNLTDLSEDTFSEVLKLAESRQLLRHEGPFSPDLYRRLFSHARTLFHKIDFLDEQLRGLPLDRLPRGSGEVLAGTLRVLGDHCEQLAESIWTSSPKEFERSAVEQSVKELEDSYGAMRAEPPVDEDERETRKEFAGIVGSVQDIEWELLRARSHHMGMVRGDISTAPVTYVPTPAPKTRLAVNWENVRHAAKVTAAILIAFGGLAYWDMPGGEQGLVAGMIVGGQANLGRSLMKWRLRATGALFGALYGVFAILVVAHLPYFPVMLWLLLIGIFIATYVAGGSERIAYAGLQAAIAISVVLVYDPGPPVSMDAVEGRFWGAVFGGLIAVVVHHLFWPVDPLESLRRHLAGVLGSSAQFFRESVFLVPDNERESRRVSELLTTEMQKGLKLLGDSRHMMDGSRRGVDLYERALGSLANILAVLSTLQRTCAEAQDNRALRAFLEDLCSVNQRVAQAFDQLQDRMISLEPLDTTVKVREIEREFHSRVEEFRRSEKTASEDAPSVATLALTHEALVRLLGLLAEISEVTDALCAVDPRGGTSRQSFHEKISTS